MTLRAFCCSAGFELCSLFLKVMNLGPGTRELGRFGTIYCPPISYSLLAVPLPWHVVYGLGLSCVTLFA